jgi:hypothetical protein
MMPSLSIEKLRDRLDHDPLTGVLTWKPRPPEDFANLRIWRTWNTRFAGKPVKAQQHRGYLLFQINDEARHNVSVHRVIWALAHGRWPLDQIDHRNGDRSDNRLMNLREATSAENHQNVRLRPMQGAWLDARKGRFEAKISVNGKQMWLGYFATREKAHFAYLEARSKLHPFQPVPRQ